MKIFLLSACLLFVALGQAQADTLFRWTDKDGKVHYGDRAPEDAKNTEAKRFGSNPTTDDDGLSYSLRRIKESFPVTLFVSSNCGEYCEQARALLNKRGIPFSEKMIVSTEDIEALQVRTGGKGIPTLMVGNTVVKGFEVGQWNDALDLVGYPKVAPYGSRPARPVVTKPETKASDVKSVETAQ